MRADLPPGYEMLVARDASRFIRSSILDVASALVFGALLASLIVLLFLRNVRSTLITAAAIPSSIIGELPVLLLLRLHAQHHDADGALALDRRC